jgi:ATP-binding protein involved in chromosome partitioning
MTESDILKALSNVQEPDLGKDLVSLNMIQDLSIDGNKVAFFVKSSSYVVIIFVLVLKVSL